MHEKGFLCTFRGHNTRTIWYIDIINCFKYISYYNIRAIYIRQYVASHCSSRFLVFACCGQAASSPPPANPNGKGGLVAQAFTVVIVGLCKFILCKSIVKIWSKTYTPCRSISVLSKNGVFSTCWRFFLENKAIWGGRIFDPKCLCRRIDNRKSFAFVMYYAY
jgi:hypothetical protein